MDNHITIALLLLASSSVFIVPNSHGMQRFWRGATAAERDPATHAKVHTTVVNGYDISIRLVVTDQDYDVITKGSVHPEQALIWTAKIGPENYRTENHSCHVFLPGKTMIGSFPVFDAEETYLGNGIGSDVEIAWRLNGSGAYEKDLHQAGRFLREIRWPSSNS